jgi:hypothetical protein
LCLMCELPLHQISRHLQGPCCPSKWKMRCGQAEGRQGSTAHRSPRGQDSEGGQAQSRAKEEDRQAGLADLQARTQDIHPSREQSTGTQPPTPDYQPGKSRGLQGRWAGPWGRRWPRTPIYCSRCDVSALSWPLEGGGKGESTHTTPMGRRTGG